MRGPRRALGGRLWLAAGTACCTLVSCTALGIGGADAELALVTGLSPEVAAWLAAEATRAEHPGADPLPLHPGAPVRRLAPDDHEVRYNRAPPHGYRISTNGRLRPPEPVDLGLQGAPMPLTSVRFEPAPRWTAFRAPGPDEVAIRIRRHDRGAELRVRLWGAPARGTLPRHLELVLALGEAIQDTARMVEQGRWGMLRERVDQALERFGPGCCGTHQRLRTRLLVHRAVGQQALGDLGAARASTARALGLAPDTPGLRDWQAALDHRLALDREAATDWHILAASPGRDGRSHRAAGHLRACLDRLLRLSPGPGHRARADDLLREDDLVGARSQLDMARSTDPRPHRDLTRLTRWHQRQGRHRAAFEVALQRLERGADPETVLAITELCGETDQPELALRLLAEHWEALVDHDRSAAEAWLHFQARRCGPEMSTRVLTAEGALPMAQDRLARWIRAGRTGSHRIDELAMLWWLRRGDRPVPPALPRRGRDQYEGAPGVSPPAREPLVPAVDAGRAPRGDAHR